MVVPCVFAEQGSGRKTPPAYHSLVPLVLLWLEHQLNLVNATQFWVQVWFGFALIDAHAFWQIEKPACLRSVALFDAFVVRRPRKCLAHESTAEGHDSGFIRQTLRLCWALADRCGYRNEQDDSDDRGGETSDRHDQNCSC